jgi:hypothetical protein
MEQEREDYADLDRPPERDLRFLWRAAYAIGGLLLIVALAAVGAVVCLAAFHSPPAAAP